jgi:hypothetical protein
MQALGRRHGNLRDGASNPRLWNTQKSQHRANHEGEVDPISVQIAGADPSLMAEAAQHNVDQGAQIIDINMGCPAKKGATWLPDLRCSRTKSWSAASSTRW